MSDQSETTPLYRLEEAINDLWLQWGWGGRQTITGDEARKLVRINHKLSDLMIVLIGKTE